MAMVKPINLTGNPHFYKIWKVIDVDSKEEFWRPTQSDAIELADEMGDIVQINIKEKTILFES